MTLLIIHTDMVDIRVSEILQGASFNSNKAAYNL